MKIYRTEYPRPQFKREDSSWINLNGEWDFDIDYGFTGLERGLLENPLPKKINVPFCPESKLSGIEHPDYLWSVWYKKKFKTPDGFNPGKERLILRFGAVDYISDTWLNGIKLGSHRGGYLPFEFDITDKLQEENEICLWVKSDARSPEQASGKQSDRYAPYGCLYPRTTGIWQTVWLERVPQRYIKDIKITPDVLNEKVHIEARFAGTGVGKEKIEAAVSFEGKEIICGSFAAQGDVARFSLDIKDPVLWDVGKGNLYDLNLGFGDDRVSSYFGMRCVEIKGSDFLLNGRKLFTRFVLDQGYYPDGIYTAPDDADIERDITDAQRFGFNGSRLHMKVFDPRKLYHADRHGHLLWGEFPNWGVNTAAIYATQSILPEWLAEIERDYNHPSIITWCPLNETGRDDDLRFYDVMYDMTHAVDPYRPMVDVSGFVHQHRTDIYDVHDYSQDPKEFAELFSEERFEKNDVYVARNKDYGDYAGQPYYVSEYGGTEWVDESGGENWGYGDAPKSIDEFYERVEALTTILLNNKYISGFCYTQLYDVYLERNGLMKFDRSDKFDEERIRKIFSKPSAYEESE